MGFWTAVVDHYWFARTPSRTAPSCGAHPESSAPMRVSLSLVVGLVVAVAIGAALDYSDHDDAISHFTAFAFALLVTLSLGITAAFRRDPS